MLFIDTWQVKHTCTPLPNELLGRNLVIFQADPIRLDLVQHQLNDPCKNVSYFSPIQTVDLNKSDHDFQFN